MAIRERRLVAILVTDACNYSAMMAENEDRTITNFTTCKKVIEKSIVSHQGEVFNRAGDSILAEFGSVVQAVNCAVVFQEGLKDRNLDLANTDQMEFRVGIHLGDTTVDENNRYGDGINIAARLQGIAEPGDIFISGAVYEDIKSKLNLSIGFIGDKILKNIARPISVYNVAFGGKPSVSQGSDAGEASEIEAFKVTLTKPVRSSKKPSIAVLPFDNIGGDPDHDILSDGLTDEVITKLSEFDNLDVHSRKTTLQYKGKSVDVRQVGRELGTSFVLEGSIRTSGDIIRITGSLLNSLDGNNVWAGSFDTNLSEGKDFAFQDSVSRKISSAVAGTWGALFQVHFEALKQGDLETLNREQSVSFVNGYYLTMDPGLHSQARDVMQRACKREPDNGHLFGLLSHLYIDEFVFGYNTLPNPLKRAMQAAQKAVVLNPHSTRAHSSLARVHFAEGDFPAARVEDERALSLNPSSASRLLQHAYHVSISGDWEYGLELYERAIELTDMIPAQYWYPIFFDNFRNQNYDDAIAALNKYAKTLLWFTHACKAAVYGELKNKEAASAAVNQLIKLKPDIQKNVRDILQRCIGSLESQDQLLDGLGKAGL